MLDGERVSILESSPSQHASDHLSLGVETVRIRRQSIIEAACAARIDALFAAVLTNEIGLKPDAASVMMRAVRAARQMTDDRKPS